MRYAVQDGLNELEGLTSLVWAIMAMDLLTVLLVLVLLGAYALSDRARDRS
jgi:hypothetical protein